jgi:hypothetical protein
MDFYKDEVLARLADTANVAQFVSFAPSGAGRFVRVRGVAPDHAFGSMEDAVQALFAASPEGSVNIRSFRPDSPQGNEFVYGARSAADAAAHARRMAGEGLHVIVNETVDVDDAGVSGVVQGGCMEFAPGVTPRFVEKASAEEMPALPFGFGMDLLSHVYGFRPDLSGDPGVRHEFSVHPKPRGLRMENTIAWERQDVPEPCVTPVICWPNPFSRLIGDKVYGLLVAHLLGARVPLATVFPRDRRIAPFTFGRPTGEPVSWARTCPREQIPGKHATMRGWTDPYVLMEADDPGGEALASCLTQQEVAARWSGALIVDARGGRVVEGVPGFGDGFMSGTAEPCEVPHPVRKDVLGACDSLSGALGGPVRLEWAHDGTRVWVLQLHRGLSASCGRTIWPGKPPRFLVFNVGDGLARLRELSAQAVREGCGVEVEGFAGMSSHIADVLRKACVPSGFVARTSLGRLTVTKRGGQ